MAELHLDTLSFDGEATSSLDLSELVGLPLTTLTLDNTNIVIDATILGNIPATNLLTLSFQNLSVPADTDFSGFESLEELNVSNNTAFTISSSDVFPSSLLSLDISGCTSITELSSVPTTLTTLSINGMNLIDKTAFGDFSDLLVLNANSSSISDEDMPYLAELSS
ncbi:hypothetical protein ADUPG1_005111, partial [Aduncisulcus paluster]